MKNRKIIENIFLALLFVIPIVIIIMQSNGITLINNLCYYGYIGLYVCIAVIYVKIKKDKNILQVMIILVAIYSIAVLYNFIGTYEIKKSQDQNTIIVERFDNRFFGSDPNETKIQFYKRVCFFFKKDLNAPMLNGRYDIYWKDDYIVITGDAAEYFIESYQNYEENSYLKNKLKDKNFEILSFDRIKIKCENIK
ncbi:MAG: hypothetical protein RR636_14845 [Clostridium sp.]|uniref:hypothetical protein n=1 Tax=Clostridium sp. TaxID=1506 RepID=UPI00305DE924